MFTSSSRSKRERIPQETSKTSRQSGIAIISVIFIMLVLGVLAFTLSFAAISEQRSIQSNSKTDKLIQIADSASERARISISENFLANDFTELTFLDILREQKEGSSVTLPDLHGIQTSQIDGTEVRWTISDVSSPTNGVGWIEVSATASDGNDNQTVIRKIGFGAPNLFELALLTETVNCMFCHLHVNGDVGALDHFRPGWGTEGVRGQGSGNGNGGSRIDGNVYAATTISKDDTNVNSSPAKVNGAKVYGNVFENSRSNKLPQDNDGDDIPDFPPIKREVARANARGSITMNNVANDNAFIRTFGFNEDAPSGDLKTLDDPKKTRASISKTFDGHVIMVGTHANPINLDEDVFFEGDVILKGVVTGTGAIYSGRNIYVAGDLTLKDPPHDPGEGDCSGVTDPDACAKINIDKGRDALRLGARANIVLGDYTEYDSNKAVPISDRQSADFYRAQFGFWGGNRYYDKDTGDELECKNNDAGTWECKNIDGTVISSSKVKTIKSAWKTSDTMGDEAYDYSFRPGSVKSDGSFNSWMSDENYRELLGTESFDFNTWRGWFPNGKNDRSKWEDQFIPAINATLPAGEEISQSSIDFMWGKRSKNGKWDVYGKSGAKIATIHKSGGTYRVLMRTESEYETQINRVEAFLYANERIAGKSSMQPMAINGGMIAQEIGVLAQGRNRTWPFYLSNDQIDCKDADDRYYVADTDDCALTVNYDHRLRNGGYGFNLVSGETGKTLSWRIGDKQSDHVPAASNTGSQNGN